MFHSKIRFEHDLLQKKLFEYEKRFENEITKFNSSTSMSNRGIGAKLIAGYAPRVHDVRILHEHRKKLVSAKEALVALQRDINIHDDKITEPNGRLKKKQDLFSHERKLEWLAKLTETIVKFNSVLSQLDTHVGHWGKLFNPHVSKRSESRRKKENKAKAVRRKSQLHKEHHNNIFQKLGPDWEEVGVVVPATYISIPGVKALSVRDFKYLKEMIEQGVFDDTATQLIADTMSKDYRAKLLSA